MAKIIHDLKTATGTVTSRPLQDNRRRERREPDRREKRESEVRRDAQEKSSNGVPPNYGVSGVPANPGTNGAPGHSQPHRTRSHREQESVNLEEAPRRWIGQARHQSREQCEQPDDFEMVSNYENAEREESNRDSSPKVEETGLEQSEENAC